MMVEPHFAGMPVQNLACIHKISATIVALISFLLRWLTPELTNDDIRPILLDQTFTNTIHLH